MIPNKKDDYYEPNNERNAESVEQDQGEVNEFKRI